MRPFRSLLTCGLLATALTAQQDTPRQQPLERTEHATAPTPPTIDEARFEELRALLRPDDRAPWRSLAWRTDLLAAQREAAASDRPLFVWAMDGHPLGCT